jgi:hypothetical protein
VSLGPDPFGVAWTHRREPEPTPDGFLVPPGMTELINRYFEENLPIAMAWFDQQGLARDEPDTRPPAARPSAWTLLRWKLPAWREQAARVAYRVLAGQWPDDGEGDW